MMSLMLIIVISLLYNSVNGQLPPRITKQSSNNEKYIQLNSDNLHRKPNPKLIIECEAEAQPPPTYYWIKNGQLLELSVNDNRIKQKNGQGTLIISQPNNGDMGQYQCFAKNKYGIATSNSILIRKSEWNSIKNEQTEILTAQEGKPFHITCGSSYNQQENRFFWLLRGYDNTLESINSTRITVDPNGNLWFSNITKNDASDNFYYTCIVSSMYLNEYTFGNSVILSVIPSESTDNEHNPIVQYRSPPLQIAIRNHMHRLFCIYGGTPLPKIIWKKDFTPLDLSTNNRVTFGDYYGKLLIIKAVDYEDEGEYTCEIFHDDKPVDKYSMKIMVLSPPTFTIEPKSINATVNDNVEFKCEAEGVPQPGIKWIYNGRPVDEASINSRRKLMKNSIVIENVTINDTGNYGCNASNSRGYVYKDVYINVLAV